MAEEFGAPYTRAATQVCSTGSARTTRLGPCASLRISVGGLSGRAKTATASYQGAKNAYALPLTSASAAGLALPQ
jgi:hypothetical protein